MGEVRALRSIYRNHDHFYVINEPLELPQDMQGRTDIIRHSERDWLFFVNLWEAWRILRREKPQVILSTGAGPAVPFALVGKLLGIKSIFIEIGTQVDRPSLTGRLMYWLADQFFYQWPARWLPISQKERMGGYFSDDPFDSIRRSRRSRSGSYGERSRTMILVTVGNAFPAVSVRLSSRRRML